MAKDYRLILKTQLDVTAIQSQIDALQKKISKTNFSVGAGGGSKGGIKLVDAQAELKSLAQVEARIKQLQAMNKNVQVTTSGSVGGKDNITTVTAKYRNAINDTITETYRLNKANDGAIGYYQTLNKEVAGTTKSISSWTDGLSNAVQRTLQYATSTMLLYGAFNELKKGIQYIKDLNKEMVNIQVLQIEGAKTTEQINNLASSFNDLAKSMGATTTEVAAGSTEWLRQGKTIAETQELLKSSLMLSKLGALDTAQSTEYLTSIMNGFKFETEQASDVVSKLISVDNIAATSAGELATALSYTSAVANQTDVSFEKMVAMIGTVSSVTRQSAEVIGTAFKTILVRMEAVAANKSTDEFGDNINNVEKSLRSVGIEIRDTATTFKSMEVVLDDVASKWDTFGTTQQNQIAGALGGLRQANTLLTLFQNYGDVQKYMTAQTESAGLAMKNYEIYLKGVEAAQNNLRASWEKLVMSSATSEFVSDIYNLGATILDLVDSMGGLKTVLIAVAVAYAYLNWGNVVSVFTGGLAAVSALAIGLKALVVELLMATNAQIGLNIAASVNPYILLATAIAALAGGIYLYSKNTESATEKLNKLNESLSDQNSKIEELQSKQKSIDDLKTKYEDLSKVVHKSTTETEDFTRIQNDLKKLVPELAGEFDDYGNFSLHATTENMNLLTTATDEQIEAQKKLREATILAQMQERVSSLIKAKEESDAPGYKGTGRGGMSLDEIEQMKRDIELARAQSEADWADSLALEKENFKTWGKELQLEYIEELRKTEFGKKMAQEIFIPLMDEAQSLIDSATPPEIPVKLSTEEAFSNLTANDDFQSLVDEVVTMLKDVAKQDKEMWQDKIKREKELFDTLKQGYRDRLDEEKRLYDIQKTNLQRQHEDEKRITDDRKDAIKDELDGYKKILNARQELLKLQKEEAEYNRTKAEKESNLAKIEAQILELSFDNSAEGITRRLELEQQAAELRQELATDASDHEYDLQQQALDAEIARAEEESAMRVKELEEEQKASDLRYEMRLRELEDAQDKSQQEYDTNIRNLENTYAAKEANFQNQIKLIDNYLSQEGLINKQAMDLILDENSGVYGKLMEWNRVYGTGIKNDIISMWELAKVAVEDYKKAMSQIEPIETGSGVTSVGGSGSQTGIAYHTGIEKGAVGGKKLQSSEEFIKVLKGEVIITPKQMSNYTSKVLPSMMNSPKGQSNFSGGATFDKLFDIVINGNLDKSTIPDLERLSTQIIDKINKAMQQRGMLRNTNLNAI